MTYAERVAELEAEGLCTSDAQAVADAEQKAGRTMTTKPASPLPWSADPEGEAAVSIEDANGTVICDVYGAHPHELAAYVITACNEYPRLQAERDAMIATLRAIASARPDRLRCSQNELWKRMREIARALLARLDKGE